jgi:hypothetical protein
MGLGYQSNAQLQTWRSRVCPTVWNLTQQRDKYQYSLKLATLKNMYLFRLNNIHGLKLTKLHKLLTQEMDYDSPHNHS